MGDLPPIEFPLGIHAVYFGIGFNFEGPSTEVPVFQISIYSIEIKGGSKTKRSINII